MTLKLEIDLTAKTALYRHWDAGGKLLYVGISLRPFERLSQHVYGSHWADTIDRVTIEYFDSRADAESAERHAIRDERPAHNVVHAVPSDRVVELSTRAVVRPDPIPEWASDAHVYRHATRRGSLGTDPEEALAAACAEPLQVKGRSVIYQMTPERAEGSMDRLVADGRLIRSLGALYPRAHGDYIHKLAIPRYLEEIKDDDDDLGEAA